MPRRGSPVLSKAPLLMSASRVRLLASCESTRAQKSKTEVKGPSARAAMIASMAPRPTPFTAFRPKRILPSTTVKPTSLSLTSGGSTSMPISWHWFT